MTNTANVNETLDFQPNCVQPNCGFGIFGILNYIKKKKKNGRKRAVVLKFRHDEAKGAVKILRNNDIICLYDERTRPDEAMILEKDHGIAEMYLNKHGITYTV